MEEDSSAKAAPVTRLRRRLSVEPEDSPLPTTPSTPNKKRITRLAAKPQLELIDEVVSESAPKRITRKTAVKENESEVTTTPTPVTPSRRNTRARSNTSLLSETITQNIESPRAKRALRRNSHLGSDTESSAPITPARQTRRTRKDSTTSIDKQAAVPDENIAALPVTVEPVAKDEEYKDKANTTGSRKSPRLSKNGGKSDNVEIVISPEVSTQDNIKLTQTATPKNVQTIEKESPKERQPDKISAKKAKLNKSITALDKSTTDPTSKRNRTKSWTLLMSSPGNVGSGDKVEKHKIRNLSLSGSGDGLINNDESAGQNHEKKSPRKSMNKSLTLVTSSIENKENIVDSDTVLTEKVKTDTVKLFENSPIHQRKPVLIVEDSDSGSVDKLVMDIQSEGDQCVPVANTDNHIRKTSESNVEPMDIDESIPANVTFDDFSDKSNNSKDEIETPKKRKSLMSEGSILKDNSQQELGTTRVSVSGEGNNESINEDQQSESLKSVNKYQRKSSLSMVKDNIIESNSSNKNSSISSLNKSEVNQNNNQSMKAMNKSKRKSSLSSIENIGNLNESSKKNESLSQTKCDQKEAPLNKSERKLSTSIVDENLEKMYESSNYVSSFEKQNESNADKNNESINKHVTANTSKNNKSLNDNSNTSKHNSLVSSQTQKSFSEEKSKTADKSKRTSSVSQTASPNHERSENENKSTLVISQLKDVSSNDTNNAMSPYATNEKSKSVNDVDIKNKVIDKKNESLNNYLTSTPIQQKSLQKLAIQMNTSIISPAIDNQISHSRNTSKMLNESKLQTSKNSNSLKKNLSNAQSSSESSDEEKNLKAHKLSNKKSLKKHTLKSSSDEASDTEVQTEKRKNTSKSTIKKPPNKNASITDSSDSDESEDDVSNDKSRMLDDEASEASDDYESGDSRDNEERRYEYENEIVEKGETLDSEDEISNDSDYEKDSFIVSSDAEDNEMLSGTGDDLSMSDNELTMSAKSKKKFNERKLKQQKNASREMYEARHMNDTKSEKNTTKKSKRQRLESSTLESDHEQPKKNNSLRIDSSQNSVKSADESIGIKKKKTKRLSESVCETTMNEKEITLLNQTLENNDDPLTAAIKLEPKTPQKGFNISTVAINENIEEVQIDSNKSMIKPSEAIDPLQSTMAADDDEEEDSLSENNEILENYDSVLNNLSLQSKKVKTLDTSLNLNKLSKDAKNPVIDQLNLTQTKKSKKTKNKKALLLKSDSNILQHDEDSSDAIDMKLLFPEDSNDSEVNTNKLKSQEHEQSESDHVIPLKRSEAKTNLHGNADTNESLNESGLNVSKKKNKKRLSSQSSHPGLEEPVILDNGIQLFIDTQGSHQELNTSEALANSNKKKKKNRSLNTTAALELAEDIDATDGVIQTAAETSVTGETKKKKNQSFNVSLNATESPSQKKSRKKSESTSDFIESSENPDKSIVEIISLNTSIKSDKKKKNKADASFVAEPVVEEIRSAKKKSKKLSISDRTEPQADIPDTQIEPVSDKKKKKKNKQNLEMSLVENHADESDDAPEEVSYKKSDAHDNVPDEVFAVGNETKKHKKNKKKKNKNVSQASTKSDDIEFGAEQENNKRKRKLSGNVTDNGASNDINSESMSSTHEKKKLKVYLDDEYIAAYNDKALQEEEDAGIKKHKKNKKPKNPEDEMPQQKPKKRKNRDNDDSDQNISKIAKQDSFDKIHVPKLPEFILNQLTEKLTKPKKHTTAAIATVPFVVEKAERRRNKPSNYLEQSVYLNDSPVKKKSKQSKHKNPKVLPFVPTALTSESGYTSRFNINLLPKDTQFVAQASNVENFRESFLGSQRIKKLGTFERCKIQRSRKLSKF